MTKNVSLFLCIGVWLYYSSLLTQKRACGRHASKVTDSRSVVSRGERMWGYNTVFTGAPHGFKPRPSDWSAVGSTVFFRLRKLLWALFETVSGNFVVSTQPRFDSAALTDSTRRLPKDPCKASFCVFPDDLRSPFSIFPAVKILGLQILPHTVIFVHSWRSDFRS